MSDQAGNSTISMEEAIRQSISGNPAPEPVANTEVVEPTVTEPETIETVAEVKVIEPVVVAPEPVTVFDEAAWLKQHFEVDNIDTLRERLNKPAPEPVVKAPEFVNEESKKIYEALIAGKENEVADYLSKKQFVSSLKEKSAEEIVKAGWKDEYGLTDKEADRRYMKETEVDDMLDDEDQAIAKKFIAKKMEKEANQYRSYFSQYEKEIKLPSADTPQPAPASAATPDFESEDAKKAISFSTGLNKSLPTEADSIPIVLKDDSRNIDYKGAYKIPQAELAEIKSNLKGHEDKFFATRWTDKNGNINEDLVAADIWTLSNREKLIQSTAVDVSNATWKAKLAADKNYQAPGATIVTGNFEPSEDDKKRAAYRAFWG